ncbi:MAG: ABC transporter ATP-binding protein [Solirubrobacterales bacterium]
MPAPKHADPPIAGRPVGLTEVAERSPAAAPALLLEDVTVRYAARGREETTALDRFSLTVAPRERVAVVGPSGCGKSTLLALAAGLIKPASGTVATAEEVALMPQRDLLVPWRTAIANAALALEAQGVSRKEAIARAQPVFERFGLAGFERSRTWELSGGMRQRVAFLRTVLTGRQLLALDEPFGALDSITRGEMQDWLLTALGGEPRTLLLVTHDIDEALTLADRTVILSPRPGRVVDEITARRPAGATRAEWITSPEFAELKAEALEALL